MRRKHQFNCPVSPHIAWDWGLAYKDCPVVASERDSEECRTCSLRGNLAEELKKEKRRPRRDSDDKDRPGKPGGRRPSQKKDKEQQK